MFLPWLAQRTLQGGLKMNTESYPKFPNKKTLSPCGDDVKNLGAHQALLNVNLPALMRMHDEGKATVAFPCNGKTYYFSRSRVEAMDHLLSGEKKRGITVTLILLNAPRFFDSFQEKELLDICIHPDFTWDDPQAFISAFPMNTEGRGYYLLHPVIYAGERQSLDLDFDN